MAAELQQLNDATSMLTSVGSVFVSSAAGGKTQGKHELGANE